VVAALIEAGALVDRQDRNQWTALMWAMTNRHKGIAKILLDAGASTDIRSSAGRTAFDFAAPHSEMSDYLLENGYHIGDAGVPGEDFYSSGLSQDRFEQEMEETEMKRRMMMESSVNLEVDLSSLGMDDRPEVGVITLRRRMRVTLTFFSPPLPDSRRTGGLSGICLGQVPA
jgi:hypothetical protein